MKPVLVKKAAAEDVVAAEEAAEVVVVIRAEAAGQLPPGATETLLHSLRRETSLARLAASALGQPVDESQLRKARRYIPVAAI